MKKIKQTILLSIIALLSACTATTSFQSKDPGVRLKINEDQPIAIDSFISKTYPTTSFGQYKFKATKDGVDPMYGLVPLKFNGGYLAADIIFFAPAMFYNLREVFPFYEFDIQQGVVRYKRKEEHDWTIYKPTGAEIEHAKRYFGE